MSQKTEADKTEEKALNVRAQIFAAAPKQLRKPITFNGVELELIQPTVGGMQNAGSTEGRNFVVNALVKFAVLPGTETRVFDEGDYDAILEMPYGAEMTEISKAVTEIFSIDIEAVTKN